MQWHANSSLYFYIVCCILLLGFSIWLDAKLNGGMRLYLCILPPPAIITSGAHLLYPSTYNTTYYTYQHTILYVTEFATPAVEKDTRKISHVQRLQIQLHVNNIVQVKYAPKWFEEDASWCRPSVRYLCKTASDGRAASTRGASWNAAAHKQPTTTTTSTTTTTTTANKHKHNN